MKPSFPVHFASPPATGKRPWFLLTETPFLHEYVLALSCPRFLYPEVIDGGRPTSLGEHRVVEHTDGAVLHVVWNFNGRDTGIWAHECTHLADSFMCAHGFEGREFRAYLMHDMFNRIYVGRRNQLRVNCDNELPGSVRALFPVLRRILK